MSRFYLDSFFLLMVSRLINYEYKNVSKLLIGFVWWYKFIILKEKMKYLNSIFLLNISAELIVSCVLQKIFARYCIYNINHVIWNDLLVPIFTRLNLILWNMIKSWMENKNICKLDSHFIQIISKKKNRDHSKFFLKRKKFL